MRSGYGLGLGLCVALALAGPCGPPDPARAQADVLPGSRRPELEPFEEEEGAPPPLELPPVPPATGPEALAPGLRVAVRGFRVEGSSVFSEAELAAATAPWSQREIGSAELLEARDAVTRLYVDAGYVSSGAVVPDQGVEGGIVVLRVVEGALERIDVEGSGRFRAGYFRTRLRRAGRAPLNVFELERQLQLFQRDPLVERVRASLEPGSRPGLSRLRLEIEESRPYGLALGFSNENSPSVGSYTGHVRPQLANLLGYGDVLAGDFEGSDGLLEGDLSFSAPLPPFDTRLAFHWQYVEGRVVEDPFDDLDIESEASTYGIALTQPVLRGRSHEVLAGLVGEYRRSRTRLLGECFAFVPGTSSCVSEVSVLRLFGEWAWATGRNAVAARSTLSVGVDALGSTDLGGGLPDSEYLAWLAQLQWAHRLPDSLFGAEVLARVDSQLADDPLLGIEKFAVGGLRTVRGYREYEFVRDEGVVASAELRIPVWRDARLRPAVQLAPFFDFGRSWNHGAEGEAKTLTSAGIGLRVAPFPWLQGELYWGHAFEHVARTGHDPQDDGIHFALTVVPF